MNKKFLVKDEYQRRSAMKHLLSVTVTMFSLLFVRPYTGASKNYQLPSKNFSSLISLQHSFRCFSIKMLTSNIFPPYSDSCKFIVWCFYDESESTQVLTVSEPTGTVYTIQLNGSDRP